MMASLGDYWRSMFAWRPLPAALITTTIIVASMALAILILISLVD